MINGSARLKSAYLIKHFFWKKYMIYVTKTRFSVIKYLLFIFIDIFTYSSLLPSPLKTNFNKFSENILANWSRFWADFEPSRWTSSRLELSWWAIGSAQWLKLQIRRAKRLFGHPSAQMEKTTNWINVKCPKNHTGPTIWFHSIKLKLFKIQLTGSSLALFWFRKTVISERIIKPINKN